MAIYRTVSLTFWTDSKIDDDFTPEDKYFMLYLITNPHTRLSGCYEIGSKQFERETGYNNDTISRLLFRMETVHDVIRYSKNTKEVLILNWNKYNWCGYSSKVLQAVKKEAEKIKNPNFKSYVLNRIENPDFEYTESATGTESVSETVTETETDISIGYGYPIDTVSGTTVPLHCNSYVTRCNDSPSHCDSGVTNSDALPGIPTDSQMSDDRETQVRIGKDSIGKESINNTSSSVNKDFEYLWALYPNKRGKDKALAAYKRAVKSGTTRDEVEAGINAYIKYINANKIQDSYIKHGSTYFNGHCWKDNYDITGVNNESIFNEYGGISPRYDTGGYTDENII